MKPATMGQALVVSSNWQSGLTLEMPEWIDSIDKAFEEHNPVVEHYLEPDSPKCVTKVSFPLPGKPGENIEAVYWLSFSNDGRLGCRFWGGAGRGLGVALEPCGSQRLRNKGQKWLQHLKMNHEDLAKQFLAIDRNECQPKDILWELRDVLGNRGLNRTAGSLGQYKWSAGNALATIAATVDTTYKPWHRPEILAKIWSSIKNLAYPLQVAG